MIWVSIAFWWVVKPLNLEVSRLMNTLRDSLVLVCATRNCSIILSKCAVDNWGGGGRV